MITVSWPLYERKRVLEIGLPDITTHCGTNVVTVTKFGF